MCLSNENTNDYKLFSEWLSRILETKMPNGIIAFNFNLYEGVESYDIQLVGSDKYDEDDTDWACSDYFTTGEDIYYLSKMKDIEYWEYGLNYIASMLKRYLNDGKKANILRKASAVGIGFVDGDIDIIYRKYNNI